MNGFGRYSRTSQLSQDSFSGRSTPDNHSFISLNRYRASLLTPDGQNEHDVLDQLTPSEAESSYPPHLPPSTISGVPQTNRVWNYVQDQQLMSTSRSPPSSGYSPVPSLGSPSHPHHHHLPPHTHLRSNPYSAPQLLPQEYQRRLNVHTPTDAVLPSGNTSSELDEEELSVYEPRHDASGYRRSSLPTSSATTNAMPSYSHHEPGKKWDFKYQRSKKSYKPKVLNGQDASVGRMSPYSTSDMSRFVANSPFPDVESVHGGSPTDPVKKVTSATTPVNARTKQGSSHSPVKPSSPVPIEPHTHLQQELNLQHSLGGTLSDNVSSKILQVQDSYDEEDDPDNGAKAASGGSRSGSKMSSSFESRSDNDHDDRQMTMAQQQQASGIVGEGGYSCTSSEPALPAMSNANRSSLRLNLSSVQQAHLHPYESPQHDHSLGTEQTIGKHSECCHMECDAKFYTNVHSKSGLPSEFVVTSSINGPIIHHSVSVNNDCQFPDDYQVPKLELVHDDSPSSHPASGMDSGSTGGGSLTVEQNGRNSLPRKTSNTSIQSSNSSRTLQNKSGSDSTSSTATRKGTITATSGTATDSAIGSDDSPHRTQPISFSESALKSNVETLNGIKQSINKAITFGQQLKALADSGSSDQDSDSEPHTSQGLEIPQNEQQKITDKMKTSVPPQQLTVWLTKPATIASFGFSVADGQYDQGVYVKAVKPGGPADGADGLRPYDRILKVRYMYT